MMMGIKELSKPVIAQVHGIATAAGCQLVATCDLAVADESARFSTPGVNIGGFCHTPMVALSRVVSKKHALEMLLLGEFLSAKRAYEIGLINKMKAYQLQDQGMDTVEANKALGFPADLRHYGIGAQILVDLGIRQMRLLTNNPRKIVGLEGYGLTVVERISLKIPHNPENVKYLETKKSKLGHIL